jgi:hypothetical protein
VQHDVLWLTLRDADPVLDHRTGRMRADADSRWQVPDFVQGDRGIVQELTAQREADAARLAELLTRMEISHSSLDGQDDAVAQLLQLLNRRSNARL